MVTDRPGVCCSRGKGGEKLIPEESRRQELGARFSQPWQFSDRPLELVRSQSSCGDLVSWEERLREAKPP